MIVFNKKPFIIADISINLFEFAIREKISAIESAKFLIDEAQSVAIGKGCRTCHVERVTTQLLDGTHKFTHRLGSVGRKDVRLTAVQEIGCEATIERLL